MDKPVLASYIHWARVRDEAVMLGIKSLQKSPGSALTIDEAIAVSERIADRVISHIQGDAINCLLSWNTALEKYDAATRAAKF